MPKWCLFGSGLTFKMTPSNETRGHFCSVPRYMTVIGVLFIAAVLVTLSQFSPQMRDFRCSITTSESLETHQVVFAEEPCKECNKDGGAVFQDFEDFAELEVDRAKCLSDIRTRLMEDYRPYFENVTRVALLDVALHTNLGDTILWRAAIHIPTLFGHTVNYVCAASQSAGGALKSFPRCNLHKVINLTANNGVIMYHAGGNWGNLYRWVQDYRLKVLKTLGKAYENGTATYKVMQLPQSIAYKAGGEHAVRVDDAAIRSLPPGMFTLFLRQQDSYYWARLHYGDNIKVRKSPDVAFSLGQLSPIGEPTLDVIFIMRGDQEDIEKGQHLKTAVAKKFSGTGLTYSFQGYGYHDSPKEYSSAVPTVVSEVRLNAVIKVISKGKLLITNRFHGHIIGMMMGKTTFWVDTIQKKLSETRRVAFDSSKHCTDKSMRSFEFKSTLDAVDAAIKHLLSNRDKNWTFS